MYQNNDLDYAFNPYGNNVGYWYNATIGILQYGFDYYGGQSYHENKFGGWATLGASGLGAPSIGNGAWNYLGGNWYYAWAPYGRYGDKLGYSCECFSEFDPVFSRLPERPGAARKQVGQLE